MFPRRLSKNCTYQKNSSPCHPIISWKKENHSSRQEPESLPSSPYSTHSSSLFQSLRSSAALVDSIPSRSGSWPICIDALLISGSLMVLRSDVQGSSSAFGWGVLITFTGISTGFNIAHSPGGFLYQASHAIPPISLCISVEVLMNIIRSDLTAEATPSP